MELNTDSVKNGHFRRSCYEFMQDEDNLEINLEIESTKIELSFGNNKTAIISTNLIPNVNSTI